MFRCNRAPSKNEALESKNKQSVKDLIFFVGSLKRELGGWGGYKTRKPPASLRQPRILWRYRSYDRHRGAWLLAPQDPDLRRSGLESIRAGEAPVCPPAPTSHAT